MQEKTIFQKIIDRDIPATIVYEDEFSIAFLDIFPVAKGHLLVVPKKPYAWITDMPDGELGALWASVKRIMIAQKKALNAHLVQVNIVGDQVPHAHIHLVPRHSGANYGDLTTHVQYEPGEAQMYAEKIIASL